MHSHRSRTIRCICVTGPAVLLLTSTLLPDGLGFVFGKTPATVGSKLHQQLPHTLRAVDPSVEFSVPNGQPPASAALPHWAAVISVAAAFGLVARLACGPAFADDLLSGSLNPLLQPPSKPLMAPPPEDPEKAAQEARAELQQANEEKKLAEKEARLKEKLAIRRMVEDKKKAEEVIQSNVRAEVEKIALERKLAQEAAADRQREALQKAIAANRLAEEVGEERRLQKLNLTSGMEPAKKALTKALAEKQAADDDVAYRKQFADKATARLEEADKLAALKKADVERAVGELAKSTVN